MNDHMRLSNNIKFLDVIKVKCDCVLFSDKISCCISAQCPSDKSFSDRVVLIANGRLFILNPPENCGDDQMPFYNQNFVTIPIESILGLYTLRKKSNEFLVPKDIDLNQFLVQIFGNYWIWFRSYPNHKENFIEAIKKSFKDKLQSDLNIKNKTLSWAKFKTIDETRSLKLFSHSMMRRFLNGVVLKEGNLLLQRRKNKTLTKKGWKSVYIRLMSDCLIIADSKKEMESLQFYYSHNINAVSGAIPLRCEVILHCQIDVYYLKSKKNIEGIDSHVYNALMLVFNPDPFDFKSVENVDSNGLERKKKRFYIFKNDTEEEETNYIFKWMKQIKFTKLGKEKNEMLEKNQNVEDMDNDIMKNEVLKNFINFEEDFEI